MRILFDSQNEWFKHPFGCVRKHQPCRLRIEIPKHCNTTEVWCRLQQEQGVPILVPLPFEREQNGYEVYGGTFSLEECGLYHYYFEIETTSAPFRLMKYGANDTNIEAGDEWQLTCFPEDYDTPEHFKGCVTYQIFPDRFHQVGRCDLSEKLQPFTMHESLDETPESQPQNGIWNNKFYGGNLKGIEEKLPYLHRLGVSVIYLNPIFMAFSNHRYDTADYKRIDPMLGTEQDFVDLCDKAHALGMKILLDGVFSHTGSDSVYFDKENRYGNGAYHNEHSPYAKWYSIDRSTGKYVSWWGIETLPCVNEMVPSYLDYIIENEDSVVAKWMRLGADGFRLDVADELPDAFIRRLHKRVKQLNKDAILVGEVWEDASNKVSYGVRRQYFSAKELDSVTNYPFRDAILSFVRGAMPAYLFAQTVMQIAEHYPKPILDCVMNVLSTHDTVRALTALGGAESQGPNEPIAGERLQCAIKRLKAAAFLQFVLPGSPCIYYGDEVGMQGGKDPFNRGYFPWDKQNVDLQAFYRALASLKKENDALRTGTVRATALTDFVFQMEREAGGQRVVAVVNVGEQPYWYSRAQGNCLFAIDCEQQGQTSVLRQNGFLLLELS